MTQEAHAQCLVRDSVVISWHAFKTSKKIGVKGSFREFKMGDFKKTKNFKGQIDSLEITIDPQKFTTGNKARDANISKFFFSDIKPIVVKVKKVSKKWITTTIKLGAKTRKTPFRYNLMGDQIKATAHIDLIDFKLSAHLAKLNKACFSMHEGKTWSHVELGLTASLAPCS